MSGDLPILAVAGRPILHSLSPLVFRELFRITGKRAAYLRVAASSAEESFVLFRALGLRGMNLTSPFKEEAASALSDGLVGELSPEAVALGAVNCVLSAGEGVPAGDGRLLGRNTDPQGVLGALRSRGSDPAGKSCLVIGAGGAGRAAAWALCSAGGRVVVANRTRERADELAARFGCSSSGLDALRDLASRADIVVSALASDALPDPEAWFPPSSSAVVLDADYKTGKLARYASSKGHATATGREWLVCQALPAYEIFMGEKAPELSPEALGGLLASPRAAYSAGRKIALIGLMGAGKSSVGRALATLAGLPFVDSDREIEREAGMPISEIFAREGESSFRALETRILDRITSRPEPVALSAGGGAAAAEANAAFLRERCATIWLYVSPSTAAARTGSGSARPLLAGTDPEARLASLEAQRRFAYASASELVISTESRVPREVAEAIYEEIRHLS
jgi:shikimate dehydrogenase